MKRAQADAVVDGLSAAFRGKQIVTTTRGNEDARDAGIPQQFEVGLEFSSTGRECIDGADLEKLLEVARKAKGDDDPIELSFRPGMGSDVGPMVIRVYFE